MSRVIYQLLVQNNFQSTKDQTAFTTSEACPDYMTEIVGSGRWASRSMSSVENFGQVV